MSFTESCDLFRVESDVWLVVCEILTLRRSVGEGGWVVYMWLVNCVHIFERQEKCECVIFSAGLSSWLDTCSDHDHSHLESQSSTDSASSHQIW